MVGMRRSRRACLLRRLLAGCTVASAPGTLVSSGGHASQPAGVPKVFVRTSGSHSELVKTIPITRTAGARKSVVMSLNPRRLPDLEQGDKLKVTAEAQVTLDCWYRQPRCVGSPYKGSPVVDAKLVLARGARVTGGRGAIPLAPAKRHVCLAGLPEREHHCMIVFTHGGTSVGGEDRLPCRPDRCRINLVMDAHNARAKAQNKLLIGGNPPDGSVSQDRGRVNAVVLRPGSQPKPDVSKRLRESRLRLNEKRVVIYSKRLRSLDRGDQLTVEGRAIVDVSHLPYPARVTSQMVLADRPDQTHPGRVARHVARGGPEITESNGFNCTHPRSPCVVHKVGIVRIARDVRDGSGDPIPLYANFTMLNTPKHVPGSPSDRVRLRDHGALQVVRYRR